MFKIEPVFKAKVHSEYTPYGSSGLEFEKPHIGPLEGQTDLNTVIME